MSDVEISHTVNCRPAFLSADPEAASTRRRRQKRKGIALVYMAILLVGFLAIMSLVIDVGFLMLSRRQMQAAVSTAAGEGLRFRDGIPQAWQPTENPPAGLIAAYQSAGYDLPSPPYDTANSQWQQYIDFARRWAASNSAGQTLYTPDRQKLLSRTIKVNVTPDSIAPLPQVLQKIDPANPYDGYPPDPTTQAVLQPNMNNEPGGDLVAGTFSDEDTNHVELHLGGATDSYSRTDFDSTSGRNAMLARMRRTGEGFTGADQSRTSGGLVTLLFTGMGVMNSSAGGSVQVPVRATAIANAQAVKSVGPMFAWIDSATASPRWITGAAPITSTTASLTSAAYLQIDGRVTTDQSGLTLPLFQMVDVTSSPTSGSPQAVTAGYSVGKTFTPPSTTTIAFPLVAITGSNGFLAYVPVTDSANLVIGFSAMRIYSAAATTAVAPSTLNIIAPENASAAYPTNLTDIPSADLTTALSEHAIFAQSGLSLMAPALVRSVSLPPPPTIGSP